MKRIKVKNAMGQRQLTLCHSTEQNPLTLLLCGADGMNNEDVLDDLQKKADAAFMQHREALVGNPDAQATFVLLREAYSAVAIHLNQLYRTDELTQLGNRHAFAKWSRIEFERALKFSRKIAIAVLDIDHFKSINDRWGHPYGDLVLKQVGRIIDENVRRIDYAGRHGGEEFLIAITNTTLHSALKAIERIRTAVMQIVLPDDKAVTLSGGLSMFPFNGFAINECIAGADLALYQSKSEGRNRISTL